MSDTTTITPEERAEIRRIAVSTGSMPGKASIYKKLAQILDALEQVEAHAEQAEADVARLTKERDWLAKVCTRHCRDIWSDGSQCSVSYCAPVNCKHSSADQWKEAARRAVANSEVNNDRN